MQWISSFNPQGNVYGIYLVHCVIILSLYPFFKADIEHYKLFANLYKWMTAQVLFYSLIMLATYGLVVQLKKTKLSFVIGRKYNHVKKVVAEPEQPVREVKTKKSISAIFNGAGQNLTILYSAN